MCGIVSPIDLKQKSTVLRPQILEIAEKIHHRDPYWIGIYSNDKVIMVYKRLSMVDLASG